MPPMPLVGLANSDGRPSTSRQRVEAIYRAIRRRICLLRYPPGGTLSEAELAQEFGVSRTPVRRALHRLEFDGLVESRRGVGTIVTTVDLRSLREVYAFRIRLAELAGEISPLPQSEESLLEIADLLAQCRALHGKRDGEAFARINMTFQEHLMRSIGNRPLREVSERLYFQTARIWLQLVPEMDWEEEVAAFAAEIEGVLAAMRKGDPTATAHIRRNHIAMSLERISRYLAAGGHPPAARKRGEVAE